MFHRLRPRTADIYISADGDRRMYSDYKNDMVGLEYKRAYPHFVAEVRSDEFGEVASHLIRQYACTHSHISGEARSRRQEDRQDITSRPPKTSEYQWVYSFDSTSWKRVRMNERRVDEGWMGWERDGWWYDMIANFLVLVAERNLVRDRYLAVRPVYSLYSV